MPPKSLAQLKAEREQLLKNRTGIQTNLSELQAAQTQTRENILAIDKTLAVHLAEQKQALDEAARHRAIADAAAAEKNRLLLLAGGTGKSAVEKLAEQEAASKAEYKKAGSPPRTI